jgi:hypothetical protein
VNLPNQKPLVAAQDAFLSQSGHFFLKVHDPRKPGATILALRSIRGKGLGESLDLECDQIIDFAPQSKEPFLSHGMIAPVPRVP